MCFSTAHGRNGPPFRPVYQSPGSNGWAPDPGLTLVETNGVLWKRGLSGGIGRTRPNREAGWRRSCAVRDVSHSHSTGERSPEGSHSPQAGSHMRVPAVTLVLLDCRLTADSLLQKAYGNPLTLVLDWSGPSLPRGSPGRTLHRG